jgi:hypothetical protein
MGRLLCVFVFMYSLALSAKRHFHLQWKRSHRSWNFASDALICPEKAKQELEPLGGLSLSYKTRTKDRIDKGLVYPNVYCSITTTTMKSNLSNTAWHMMKHRLLPDFRILTGQLREHLTETYNEPRAKTGGHGRWLKLVEVGFQFLSLSLSVFSAIVYKLCFQMSVEDRCNFLWLNKISNILNECGMSNIWNTQTFLNSTWLINTVKL